MCDSASMTLACRLATWRFCFVVKKKIDNSIDFFRLADETKFSVFSVGKLGQIRVSTIPGTKLIPYNYDAHKKNSDDRFGGYCVSNSILSKHKIGNRIFWISRSGFFHCS